MTRIVTSSWFQPLPPDHIRIGISRGVPRRGLQPGFRRYWPLTPGKFLRDPNFTALYLDQLGRLDPAKVAADLHRIAGDRVPVLICWERVGGPGWCHRALVADWLGEAGITVRELGFEGVAEHPLRQPARGATLFP